ncbi:uncharacterized protein L969DRAFT_86437 [Mixia osmundae IAM 14324]|uniref:uncharacterized protein n=1 Tax=Mixia osmundae (strain CBS 9802 / IAM 14324 / JCM 22182 / KY 12970) TaxID=764103 RepID=UPI0004A55A09|nr:uncharacterized protein L969DRAFT_86437 [Mixia osmundae IAM 14324]KEI39844.1 hypothetical protein L969DRAFT_86437 [Mixia osmundae IAM 14324]
MSNPRSSPAIASARIWRAVSCGILSHFPSASSSNGSAPHHRLQAHASASRRPGDVISLSAVLADCCITISPGDALPSGARL